MVECASNQFHTHFFIAMTPIQVNAPTQSAALVSVALTQSAALSLQLHPEHQRRYEKIKAWREAQSDPYFSEVSAQWRRKFRRSEPQSLDCESSG
jgi:hypothetical protein